MSIRLAKRSAVGCNDCGAQITAIAFRCRSCQMRFMRKNNGGWNKIGDKPLTGAEIAARYRAKHPERSKAASTQWKLSMRTFVATYKAERGCEDCGTTDARVLDLHHRDKEEKVMAVSQMINRHSKTAVLAEMDKCRVLCANCHRIEHYSDDAAGSADVGTNGVYQAS